MKKLTKKSISILTTILLILSILPYQTSAASSKDQTSTNLPSQFQSPPAGSKEIVGEDLSKREANVKHFLLKDHTYEADVYPYPVHYLTNGKWTDIDNSLNETTDSETNDKVLENKDNPINVHFAKKTSKKDLVKIKSGDYSLGWNLDNVQDTQVIQDKVSIPGYDSFSDNDKKRTLQKISSSVTYPNVMPNTDLQYKLVSGNVKENLILKDVPTISQYSFHYNTKSVKAELKNNTINFYSASDSSKKIFTTNK
jgi:mRNA-degrading endonuclease RelE of RelBE toxin-antitoxin system